MPRYTTNLYFPTPHIQVKIDGKWTRVTTAVDGIGPAIQRGYDRVIGRISKRLLRDLRMAIESGGPDGVHWEPLSPKTLETYAKHGWNTDGPYNRTGLFYRSLGLYKYGKRTYVGLPSNIRTKGGLTMVQLARLLETGTTENDEGEEITKNHIPPRPLFQPTFQAMGGMPYIKRELLREIRSELLRLGFHPNQVK